MLNVLGGPSQIAGVQSSLLKNNPDGTFSLDELREKIRKNPDCHEPITSLIIVENTHNMCGGKVSGICQCNFLYMNSMMVLFI